MATIADKDIENIIREMPYFKGIVGADYSGFKVDKYGDTRFDDRTKFHANDLHPDFMRYTIALMTTLNEIEESVSWKPQKAAEYGKQMEEIVKSMTKGPFPVLPKTPIEFKNGFPADYEGSIEPALKFPVKGLNMISTKTLYNATNPVQGTAYVKVIMYLYFFIALLEKNDSVTGIKVIDYLEKCDKLEFCKLVSQITDDIMSRAHTNPLVSDIPKSVVLSGVLSGLRAVAQLIIQELFKFDKAPLNTEVTALRTELSKTAIGDTIGANADFSTDVKPKILVAFIVNPDPSTAFDTVATAIVAWDNPITTDGGTSTAADITTTYPGISKTDSKYMKMIYYGALNSPQLMLLGTQVAVSAKYEDIIKGCSGGPVAPGAPGAPGPLHQLWLDAKAKIDALAAIDAAKGPTFVWNAGKLNARTKSLINTDPIYGAIKGNNYDYSTKMPSYAIGGTKHTKHNLYGGALEPVAPFLYLDQSPTGLPAGDTTRFRLTNKSGATNSALIDPVALKKFDDIIKAISARSHSELITNKHDNFGVAIIVGLLNTILENNGKGKTNLTAASLGIPKISKGMVDALDAYATLHNRFDHINTTIVNNIEALIETKFNDTFVKTFMRASKQLLTIEPSTGVLTVQSEFYAKERNPLSKFKDLYEKVLLKDKSFYDEYFHLVRIDPVTNKLKSPTTFPVPDLPLDKAQIDFNAGNKDAYDEYSINIRKVANVQLLGGGNLYGGALDPNDIMILNLFPDVDINAIGDILLDPYGLKIEHVRIATREFIRDNIVRELYIRIRGKNNATLDTIIPGIGPIKITPADMLAVFARVNFRFREGDPFRDSKLKPYPLGVTDSWTKLESDMEKHIRELSKDKRWEREYNKMYFRDVTTGQDIKLNVAQSGCLFFKDEKWCVDFFNCVNSKDHDACIRFLTENVDLEDINFVSQPDLIKKVQEINPINAVNFLDKLGFRSYEKRDVEYPANANVKVTEYKVECVSSWLENLKKLQTDLKVDDPNFKIILDRFNPTDKTEFKKREKFLDFLAVLVGWVNANPQAINAEETFDVPAKGKFNVEKLKLFDYYPRRGVKTRLTNLCDTLIRVKAGLESDTLGLNPRTLVANILTTPQISMPLNVPIWSYANPVKMRSQWGQWGGHRDLDKLFESAGYKFFNEIYESLKESMTTMGQERPGASGAYKIRLKKETEGNIQKKLDTMKAAEEEVKKEIQNLIDEKQLYDRSYSKLDLRQIRDKNGDVNQPVHDRIRQKQAHVIGLVDSYNKRLITQADIMLTFADVLKQKYGAQATGTATSDKQYQPLNKIY